MGALMAHKPSMTLSPQLNATPRFLTRASSDNNFFGSVIVRSVRRVKGFGEFRYFFNSSLGRWTNNTLLVAPGVRRKLIADQNRIAEDLLALHLLDTNPFAIAQLVKRGIFAGHVSQVFHDRQRDLADA